MDEYETKFLDLLIKIEAHLVEINKSLKSELKDLIDSERLDRINNLIRGNVKSITTNDKGEVVNYTK